MKKLLSILATVGLSTTVGTAVIACGTTDNPEEKGDFTVQLAKETKMVVGQEGKLEVSNYNELRTTLKDFVIIIPTMGPGSGIITQVSFNEETGIFTIKGLKLGSVKVQVQAVEINNLLAGSTPTKKLSNKLTIDVNKSNRQLSEIVTVRDLKTKEGKDLPNKEDITIIEAVEYLNPEAVGKVKIEEDSITDTSAKIIAIREGEFIGSVPVNFKVTPLPKLNDLFEKTDLGDLDNKKPLTIIQAVEYWNKNAKGKVAVKEGSITDTSAKIIPKFDGQYQGEVDVTFKVKIPQ